MSIRKTVNVALMPALMFVALGLSGCLTQREIALQARMPQNHVFHPGEIVVEMGEGPLALVNRSKTQSVCVLRVPKNGKIKKTYHREMDVTLVVVEGAAAVEVEEARHEAEIGDTIVLPRMTAYSIIPTGTEQDFVALVIYSPEYRPLDIHRIE